MSSGRGSKRGATFDSSHVETTIAVREETVAVNQTEFRVGPNEPDVSHSSLDAVLLREVRVAIYRRQQGPTTFDLYDFLWLSFV